MVKPLSFKGDKRPKKRKRAAGDAAERPDEAAASSSTVLSKIEDPAPQDDDSWVAAEVASDVVGPVVLVLPSRPPTCVACDANGKVFASPLENIIDGNPATAEPHDVRQVWVANRLVGTENFSLKSCHSKYLSADQYGVLSADQEAISSHESFAIIPTADSPDTFQIRTSSGTFLTAKPPSSSKPDALPEVRGDATDISSDTTLRVRMQARFKPRLKALKEEILSSKISRKELEQVVGRRLEDDEVRKLKKARRDGDYHEALLDIKVKNKHDKYS